MPAPIYWAHKLSRRLTYVRKNKILDFLRPDGKTQVAVEYVDGKPVRIDNVVVACQHDENIAYHDLVEAVRQEVIYRTLPENLVDKNTKIYINTTGRFVIGGPMEHAGGPYRIPNTRIEGFCAYTNNPVGGAFRGFGVIQASFAVERAMFGTDPYDAPIVKSAVWGSYPQTMDLMGQTRILRFRPAGSVWCHKCSVLPGRRRSPRRTPWSKLPQLCNERRSPGWIRRYRSGSPLRPRRRIHRQPTHQGLLR